MAELPSVFNAKKHEGRMGFDPLPAGDYDVMVIKSEMKKNSQSEGEHLSLQMKVQGEGKYKGRILFSNWNLINSNPVAVEIAQNEMASCCEVLDIGELKDSSQLHDKPFMVTLKVVEATKTRPADNAITAYKRAGSSKNPFE